MSRAPKPIEAKPAAQSPERASRLYAKEQLRKVRAVQLGIAVDAMEQLDGWVGGLPDLSGYAAQLRDLDAIATTFARELEK